MEAFLSWRGILFLTHMLISARGCTHSTDTLNKVHRTAVRVTHTQSSRGHAQTDINANCSLIYPWRQRWVQGVHFLTLYLLVFLSDPLATWCVQLYCQFISLPTQQPLIYPTLWLLHNSAYQSTRGGCYFRGDERLGLGNTTIYQIFWNRDHRCQMMAFLR